MRVSLFVTCLVDQLRPEVGRATVEVLRRAGCEVVFDDEQTCCGQPAYNTGYHDEAADVARRFLDLYDRDDVEAVVLPSGSCCAMVHHMHDLFAGRSALRAKADRVAAKTHELGAFLVDVLGIDDVGARFDGRVSWHDACHGLRDLGLHSQPRRLIEKVRGAELVEMGSAESCCGFGGTFSVKYPEISVAILDRKLEGLTDVDAVVSSDASCLMQISGRLQRLGSPIRALHLAELLASGAGA